MSNSVQELSALCAWPTVGGVMTMAILMGMAPFVPIVWKNTVRFWRSVALLFRPYNPRGLSQAVKDDDSFLGHLAELRLCLLRVAMWVGAAFVVLPTVLGAVSIWCEESGDSPTLWERIKRLGGSAWRWFFEGAGDIYSFLAVPLLESLPETGALIAIGMVSPILVPMKAAFFFALCVMMPFILSEAWKFVAPGLYDNEKGIAGRLVATSAALFYVGIAFAYLIVFHVVFGVIVRVTPDTVNWTPDIGELFGGMLLIFFSFGLVFELPVAMFILVRAGVVELDALKKARRYVIVGAFVVAAIVTPPDIWSQIIFALLCCLLYEVGLLVAAKWAVPKGEAEGESKPETSSETSG